MNTPSCALFVDKDLISWTLKNSGSVSAVILKFADSVNHFLMKEAVKTMLHISMKLEQLSKIIRILDIALNVVFLSWKMKIVIMLHVIILTVDISSALDVLLHSLLLLIMEEISTELIAETMNIMMIINLTMLMNAQSVLSLEQDVNHQQ